MRYTDWGTHSSWSLHRVPIGITWTEASVETCPESMVRENILAFWDGLICKLLLRDEALGWEEPFTGPAHASTGVQLSPRPF